MKIEHFGGLAEIADEAALDGILTSRYGNQANEYLMSGDERYPLLTIQVHGSVACLHYFPAEDHPGFLSVGDELANDVRTFYTNTPTEEIEVAADSVVPFEQAREGARDFFRSGSMPSSLRWKEL